jgi:hypothetical protein
MSNTTLDTSASFKSAIWSHLLPVQGDSEPVEQAAFGFAKTASGMGKTTFNLIDWLPIEKASFAHQSECHIELADETRAYLIKRAHDLQASLIEFHSHPFASRAEFSPSDLIGLEEFVPHVWWRLKGKPYLAIVVTPTQFDAVAWISSPASPAPLHKLRAGDTVLRPSGLTFRSRWLKNEKRTI